MKWAVNSCLHTHCNSRAQLLREIQLVCCGALFHKHSCLSLLTLPLAIPPGLQLPHWHGLWLEIWSDVLDPCAQSPCRQIPILSLTLLSQEAPTSLELNLSSLSQAVGMLLSHSRVDKRAEESVGQDVWSPFVTDLRGLMGTEAWTQHERSWWRTQVLPVLLMPPCTE